MNRLFENMMLLSSANDVIEGNSKNNALGIVNIVMDVLVVLLNFTGICVLMKARPNDDKTGYFNLLIQQCVVLIVYCSTCALFHFVIVTISSNYFIQFSKFFAVLLTLLKILDYSIRFLMALDRFTSIYLSTNSFVKVKKIFQALLLVISIILVFALCANCQFLLSSSSTLILVAPVPENDTCFYLPRIIIVQVIFLITTVLLNLCTFFKLLCRRVSFDLDFIMTHELFQKHNQRQRYNFPSYVRSVVVVLIKTVGDAIIFLLEMIIYSYFYFEWVKPEIKLFLITVFSTNILVLIQVILTSTTNISLMKWIFSRFHKVGPNLQNGNDLQTIRPSATISRIENNF
ncbi:hypothetical protein CAEBREN_15302 [Caenorhabditis brenneri]|uniref:G-protein coupled receptors family 1 profile domain-containing protein n=1 Tax=Caenorhabditis brenneri TaxID=135651 RepID=G0MI24_CAEBE|nr:hypothetical protein CAEBREN_15302 [Caenorhabditis brenneri]